jgi:hypothetical protein
MSLLQLIPFLHKVLEDDIHILTWGWNHMHDEAVVHKDEWEDYFQHCALTSSGPLHKVSEPLTGRSSFNGTSCGITLFIALQIKAYVCDY